jgi:hypothetical protein
MPAFSTEVVVTEVKADFDPYGNEYTHISFGYKLPAPPLTEAQKAYPAPAKPVAYKHAIHVIIPRDKWAGQYTMWQEFHLTVKDNGEVELKGVE